MTKAILVTGGTGRLGRRTVLRLQEAGRDVRVLTRRSQEAPAGVDYVVGDLSTGEGWRRQWPASGSSCIARPAPGEMSRPRGT